MTPTVIPASDDSPRAGTQSHKPRPCKSPWVPDISLAAKFRDDIVRSLVLVAAAFAVLPTPDATAQPRRERPAEEAPEQYAAGPNRDDTFYFCTACHGFKIVAQQGMSRERWNETFDVMTKRHGMVDVQGEQREQMLDYLASAFPERRTPGGWKNPFEGK
jgi:hypothetical protein